MWAAEGDFMLHGEAIFSIRKAAPTPAIQEIEAKLAVPVQHDLDWLEEQLRNGATTYLAGNEVTVADTMMVFSVQDIFANKLGTAGRAWPRINEWLKHVESGEIYQRALQRTGYHF